MTEWRTVVGDPRYEVSSGGQVRHAETKRTLKPGKHPMGYLMIRNMAPGASRTLHRLVARAFLRNPDSLPFVNHLNGVKSDNRVENLEWCTPSRNILHAIATGLNSSQGETHHYAKLTETEARLVITLRASGWTLKAVADHVGTTQANVSSISRGKSWKHLSRVS